MAKQPEPSGVGVLSLYAIEAALVALVVTRALPIASVQHGPGLAAAAAAVAAVFFAFWATGWPVYVRALEYRRDDEQRRLHPGSTFRGRMPPMGPVGVAWKIATPTVGALFGAHNALYEKAAPALRPPLAIVWLAVGVAAVALLPTRAVVEEKKAVVVDDAPIAPPPEKDPYACPAGAEKKGAPPPDGKELWCESDGKKNGPYRKWHDDASERVAVQGSYKDDKRDGMWRSWYSSGQLMDEGAFIDGKPDGHHQAWNERGKKILDTTYDNGVEMKKH